MCFLNEAYYFKNLAHFEFFSILILFLIFQCVDMWKRSPCNLAIPSEVDVSQFMNCIYFHTRFLSLIATDTLEKQRLLLVLKTK